MQKLTYDMVVIGTGPGGEGAAMQATKLGRTVAAVERMPLIGGSCTHRGTIPSKALRFAIFQLTTALSSKLSGDLPLAQPQSFPALRRSAASVIDKQVDMRRTFYDRNGVTIHHGQARFRDPHIIEVGDEIGGKRLIEAQGIILAPGSQPFRPPDVDFSHPRICDSDSILDLPETPRSISIYGAGVVGCEYASMFRNLGVKVNLINTRQKLLEFLDDEIIDALSYHLRERGVIIRHGESYERVEPAEDGVVVQLKSGKQIKTDILLWAAGRSGNSNDMGLEEIGIQPNARGCLEVNADFQTNQPHIYAVGDVIGVPALASAAYVQGRYSAHHFINGSCERAMITDIPTGIYTSPEISSLGKTERELTAAGVPYEVGQSIFKSLARRRSPGRRWGCSNCCSTGKRCRFWAFTALGRMRPRSFTSAKRSCPSRASRTRCGTS